MNCVINPTRDCSNPKPTNLSKKAKLLSSSMGEIGSVDPWCFLFLQSKSFSSFSPYNFYIDQNLLSSVSKVKYSPILESDHAPVLRI